MKGAGVSVVAEHGAMPEPDKNFHETLLLKRLTITFGLLAISVAELGMAGMYFRITLLSSIYPGYKTMAFSAALIWIFLGSVLMVNAAKPFQGRSLRGIRTILVAIAIVEAIDILFSFLGDHLIIETWSVQAGMVLFGSSSSPISPVAAGFIVLAAAAMFFLLNSSAPVPENNRVRDYIALAGILIALVSFAFVLSYVYGDPFLYGTPVIPIAGVSALAAFFTGSGLVAAAGPSAIPVRYVTGNSTRSRLLRIFIPVTIVIVLCENLLFSGILPLYAFPDALLLSASMVLFIFVTTLLVARISRGLGHSLDLAEQALKLKNDDLGAMNEELLAIEEELRQNIDQGTRKERELAESNERLRLAQVQVSGQTQELAQSNILLKTEIEEHTRTELALRESEQRFRLALRNAPVSVIIQDLDLVFLWTYNQRTKTPEDLVGKTDTDIFLPEDAARLIELKQKVIVTGKEAHEQIWLTVNGERLFFDLYLEPLRDDSGKITGIGTAAVDLTGEKLTETALRDNEQRLREADNLLEAVTDATKVIIAAEDTNFRYTYFNKTYASVIRKLTGKELATGVSMIELFSDLPKEQRSELGEWSRVLEGENVNQRIEFGDPSVMGKTIYNVLHVPLRDAGGAIVGAGEVAFDVTEQVRVEKMLLETSQYLTNLIHYANAPIIVWDRDFRITRFNHAFEHLSGRKAGDVIGQHLTILLPTAHLDEAMDLIKRTSVGELWESVEIPILHRDGTIRIVLWNSASIFGSDEKTIVSTIAQGQDITDRKNTENTLRETSQYLTNLIDYANAPIIVWDRDFRITRFNHAFEHLTGRMVKEVIGQPLDILLPPAHLDEAMDLIKKTSVGEPWESVEIPILQKNGSIRTVLWNSASIFGSDGRTIISIIAQGQDITDRKETEKALRETLSLLNASLESTEEGIYVVDTHRKITSYNQNFVSLWNIPKGIFTENDDRKVSEFIQSGVKDPKGFLAGTNDLYKHPDRESFDMIELLDGRIFERHSKPQKLKDVIIGRVWSYRDITDRRRAEESLVASLEEKEVLLREIHHRVKNNLQLISGLLDMTRMRTQDELTNSILTDMMLKIQTMAQIHTRLYESKQFGKISLTSQIRDQVAALSNIYSHKGHDITCEISSEEVFLPVDQAIPCALVVNEILSNAYKHAFKGRKHGTIEISAFQENGQVRISVRDDGVGIPETFDISRANSLGLKLIRTLVQHQLKGSIMINSQNGTAMIVEFPVITEGK